MIVQEFNYSRHSKMPEIPVNLHNGSKTIEGIMALVDTGASHTVFNWDMGKSLGLKIKSGQEICLTGFGSKVLIWLHKMKLEIGPWNYITDIGFVDKGISLPIIGVLGHKGFFERFDVTFRSKIQTLEITYRK